MALYRRYIKRQVLLKKQRFFSELKLFSASQLKIGRRLQRRANAKLLLNVIDEMKRYSRRKIFEHANSNCIKAIKANNLKELSMRALKKYVEKAKEIKGDVIQTRLFDAEEVILDENNKFVIPEGDVNFEFVSVQSTSV